MPDGLSSSRLEDLQMRWQQDPDSRIYLQLAEEYRKLDRHPEAIDVLKRGLRSRPNDLSGQVALGRCHLEMDELDAAAQSLETVVGRDPTHIVGNKLLLEAYLKTANAEKAGERLDLYKLLNPSDPDMSELEGRLRSLRREAAAPPAVAGPAAATTAEIPIVPAAAPAPVPPEAQAPAFALSREAAAQPERSTPGSAFETWPGGQTTPTRTPAAPAPDVPAIEEPPAAVFEEPPAPPEQPASSNDDIFQLGPPAPAPSLDDLFDLAPAKAPPPSLDDLWGSPAEPATSEPAEDVFAPEPVEELVPEPIEEISAPEPIEDVAAPELIEEEISAPEPVEDVAEPEPAEEAVVPEPVEEVVTAEPVEEIVAPEPVEEIATAEPVEEIATAELVEEIATPEPVEEIATPEPVEEEPATATLGELYLKQGYVNEAESIFRQVLRQDPGNGAALAGLARIRGERGLTAHSLLARDPRQDPPMGLTAKKIRVLETYVQLLRQASG